VLPLLDEVPTAVAPGAMEGVPLLVFVPEHRSDPK